MKFLFFAGSLVMLGLSVVSVGAAENRSDHRYLVERSFPQGALAGLDDAGKAKVNLTNARFGVRWVVSYATADKTRTYCIYEGPDERAIRDAAAANHMSVESITEVPVTIDPR